MSQEATVNIVKQVASVGSLTVENAAEILSIIQGGVASEKPLFSREQVATIRDRVNAKVDQSMGASNNSNTQYQKINDPELWLTRELQDTMLANPPTMAVGTKIQFRLNCLAEFFGRGGMIHPTEYTSRDIASLAFLDQTDALVTSEGLAFLRSFKALTKQVALAACERLLVEPPTMKSPDSMKEENPLLYNNMYEGKEPGPAGWVHFARLVSVRRVLGCRSTHSSANGAYPPASRPSTRQKVSPPMIIDPAPSGEFNMEPQSQGLVLFDSIGRQFTFSRQALTKLQPWQGTSPQLALMDSAPLPGALALMDSAPLPGAAGTQGPTAADTRGPTAAGTQGPTAAGTEGPTAAGTQAQTAAGTQEATAKSPQKTILHHIQKMKMLAPGKSGQPTKSNPPKTKNNKSTGGKKFGGTKKHRNTWSNRQQIRHRNQ